MKNYTFSVFLLSCIIIAATGCSDEWSFASKTPSSSVNPPAKLVGYVGLHDEHGGGILDTGVTITLSNANPVKAVTTDFHGRFEIDSITPGTYDLTYEKTGYGTYKAFGFVLPGGNTAVSAGKINLVKLATAVVDSLAVDTSSSDHILFSAFLHPSSGDSSGKSVRFFVGMDDPNVSMSGYSFTDTDYGTITYNSSRNMVQYCLPVKQVSNYVVKNLPLYAVAYGAPDDNPGYFDITSGNTVWPALNNTKSNVVTFQVH